MFNVRPQDPCSEYWNLGLAMPGRSSLPQDRCRAVVPIAIGLGLIFALTGIKPHLLPIDPDYNAWVSSTTGVSHQQWSENADMCVWTFGGAPHAGTAADPQPPNVKFKGIPYLIQQNWVNAKGGYCALSWDE